MSKRNAILKLVALFASCAAIASACTSAPPVSENRTEETDEKVASAEQLLCTGLLDGCSDTSECCDGVCQGHCCLPNGTTCTTTGPEDESCCTGKCNRNGECASCSLVSESCTQDSDCCEGECRSGFCRQAVGDPCGDGFPSSQCATQVCYEDTCQCLTDGDGPCQRNSDCCEGYGAICNPGVKCCIPAGLPAHGESGCCFGHANDDGNCCNVAPFACTQNSDCCSNSCVSGHCQ